MQEYVSKSVFNEIIEKVNNGKIAEAEQDCRRSVEQCPSDVNVLGLLGAVLIKQGKLDQAEPFLRKTIALAPSFAKPHEDLGNLLMSVKKTEEAVELFKRAVHLDPSLASAHFSLGKALALTGRGKEADEAYEKSFALSPVRDALAKASQLHQQGKFEEAEKIYRQVLAKEPENVDALRMLAMIAAAANKPDDCERLLRKVISLAPDFALAQLDMGRTLKEQDRFEEAIYHFRKATTLEPGNAQAHFLLGGVLAPAAQTEQAAQAYKDALTHNPNHAAALLGLGHVLKTLGQQEAGIQAYRDCIKLKPENGETYWSLANLKTFSFSEEELNKMIEMVEGKQLEPQSEVNFLFALGKAFEDRKDFDQAWQYYDEGNQKQRALINYDPVLTEVQNDDLLDVYTREFMAEFMGKGNPDASPIFVLGLPRTGSTLIEQILASHSQVEGTSELPYIGRACSSLNRNRADGINYPQAMRELQPENLVALGQLYLDKAKMHRQEGTPYFIDKMPNNFPSAGFIKLILPNAKIIDTRKHPFDACLGNYKQLFAKGQNFTYDLTDIGEYFLQYERLMDHWDTVMPGEILHVQYEDTVMDFENTVRRIFDFCGLPFEEACLNFHETDRAVRTASSEQVRQPIYTGAINRWRYYENHLEELIEVIDIARDRYRQYEEINAEKFSG